MHGMLSFRVVVRSAVILAIAGPAFGQVSPGFRMFGSLTATDTHLLDTNNTIVHTWPSTFQPGAAVCLLEDGTLLRAIKTPGATGGGTGGGVQRLALDGTVLFDFRWDGTDHWQHHDLEPLPNGNFLMISYDHHTAADAIAAGRDPALMLVSTFKPDSVLEVQPTGPMTANIVWQWRVWDHLIQDVDSTKANYGVVADHPELIDVNYPPMAGGASDFNHMNSVKYDAVHDRIIVSAFSQNEIWVIDHSTTTAEAAGHTGGVWGKGGDLLYRWGNPEAYDRGTAADRVFGSQHSARIIPPGYPGAGNFTVFNNNPPGVGSAVVELVPPLDVMGNFVIGGPGVPYGPAAPVWSYTAPGFDSPFISSAQRMQNGNTLVCSGAQNGWMFEVTPGGLTTWTYTFGSNVFHAQYIERKLWADKTSLSAAAGGTLTFDVIAGSPFAGKAYVVLASGSGTTPGVSLNSHLLPLNVDDVFFASIANANTPVLTNTFGFLSPLGRATASFNLPPALLPSGVMGHFACAIVDLGVPAVVGTSNAVPLTLTP